MGLPRIENNSRRFGVLSDDNDDRSVTNWKANLLDEFGDSKLTNSISEEQKVATDSLIPAYFAIVLGKSQKTAGEFNENKKP